MTLLFPYLFLLLATSFNSEDSLKVSFGASERPSCMAAEEEEECLRTFVRDQVRTESFYRHVMPRLFLGADPRIAIPVSQVLKTQVVGKRRIYFLDALCKPEAVSRVAPWWDAAHPIWICNDSYRPDLMRDPRWEKDYAFCEGLLTLSHPEGRICGCGPKLVNCARDSAHRKELVAAQHQEILATIKHVVTNGLPFSSILTIEETVRQHPGDFVYQRAEFFPNARGRSLPANTG